MTEQTKDNSVIKSFWEWIKALAIAIILATVIRHFLFAPILVDGQSMYPTLHDGDRMIVNKLSYLIGEPERFDIVVFHYNQEQDYIKRVIGLPGDHIEYKDDVLYINGQPYDEQYLNQSKAGIIDGLLTESFNLEDVTNGEFTVPEGQLFVMGDNRRHSKDSRHIGTINSSSVVGKTSIIYWPFSRIDIVQ
ncbi:signal peptidase I [Bacillus sp. HMF5848]|uniref:signal peptidase I n=1 Tax=Bacillus sp. HMF5848 TaxID=2495421 RepID=UPI000F79A355|nr:signal peptidase I [Bacillus sp. HMF5848]RSK27009.1 signal peptidase I [Bacillus sp. HMF5848]